jgi:hypothetical protein
MLIEVAMATVLIGVAFVAVMQFMTTATVTNSASTDVSTGLNLARSGREWACTQPYADLSALHTSTKICSPVIDGQGNAMSGYPNCTQEISSQYVNPADLSKDSAADTNLLRITVQVKQNGQPISSQSWMVSNVPAATQPAGGP